LIRDGWAGWRTDDKANVAPLPASPEAQRKLKAAGIDRPVHDSRHPNWNNEVIRRLQQIEQKLRSENIPEASETFSGRARDELEQLQRQLRDALKDRKRLTDGRQNDMIPIG
jgi:hypothetical protein